VKKRLYYSQIYSEHSESEFHRRCGKNILCVLGDSKYVSQF